MKLSEVYARKHQQRGESEMPANFQELAESVRDRLTMILGPMGWEVELRLVPAPFGNGLDRVAEMRCSLAVRDPRGPRWGRQLAHLIRLDERNYSLRDRGFVERHHLRLAQQVLAEAVQQLDAPLPEPDAVVNGGGT